MKLGTAILIKHKTDNGMWSVKDHVPLGKEYVVDYDTIHEGEWFNLPHRRKFKCVTVDVQQENGAFHAYPVELLQFKETENIPTKYASLIPNQPQA